MSGHTGVHPWRQQARALTGNELIPDVLLLAAAFFLVRAALLEELFPFGPAIIIAAGSRRRLLWPAVLVAAVSVWLAGSPQVYSRLLIFLFLGLTGTLYPSLRQRGPLTRATLAPVAIILVRGLSLTIWQPSFYGWVQIIFEALLAWGLTLGLLETAAARRQEERLLGGGLFLLGLLLGLQGWQVAGLSIQGIISRYILLLAALVGGPGVGAAAGAAVGFLPSLAALITPSLAGLMAFTGLVAGSLRNLGKPGVISGFLLAHLVLANYFLGSEGVLAALRESGLAILAMVVTPPFLVNYFREFLTVPAATQPVPAGTRRQENLKQALKSLARNLRFHGYDESPLNVVRQVARAACRGCPAGKVCWELEGEQMLNTLQDLLQQGSKGPLTAADLPEWLASRCGRGRELLAALTTRSSQGQKKPAEDGLTTWLASIFDNLAAMVDNAFQMDSTGDGTGQPALKVSVGMASIPRHRADVTGDAFVAATLEPSRQLLILGDGMGAGREAADASGTALELLQDLLAAGFSPELALRTVNMILLLRTSRENFTTLDLAMVNCQNGQTEFYKLGACPSFIQRQDGVKLLRSHSLPVGILEDLQVEPLREELQEGDLLVMVSDGVLEAHRDLNEKEKWVSKALQRAGEARPQEIADRLLRQARALVDGDPPDDMTVVVARVEKAAGG
ncbi:SpoIIE family protein phosphatase [Moorella sp. Hama-1]|uniref:SpoIIE family protein phosphatase n=1 Tax=Moorella sp. Hama-1 TaxID=2138101 RepID=UPI000D647B59|nr:SpoIIE family protein phosphatase [Moorella sp. Hama-1]MDN5361141.1 stage sporulation protein [Moorella sp. (in: firmicutes)]BCV20051.1 serine phosphatase [Moorella sp. Hama-1]